MTQITTTIKIDAELKKEIQELAKNMGLSFSDIVEGKLREVRRERRVVFEEYPNSQTAQTIQRTKRDAETGRNIVGPFDSPDELMQSLRSDEG